MTHAELWTLYLVAGLGVVSVLRTMAQRKRETWLVSMALLAWLFWPAYLTEAVMLYMWRGVLAEDKEKNEP